MIEDLEMGWAQNFIVKKRKEGDESPEAKKVVDAAVFNMEKAETEIAAINKIVAEL